MWFGIIYPCIRNLDHQLVILKPPFILIAFESTSNDFFVLDHFYFETNFDIEMLEEDSIHFNKFQKM